MNIVITGILLWTFREDGERGKGVAGRVCSYIERSYRVLGQ